MKQISALVNKVTTKSILLLPSLSLNCLGLTVFAGLTSLLADSLPVLSSQSPLKRFFLIVTSMIHHKCNSDKTTPVFKSLQWLPNTPHIKSKLLVWCTNLSLTCPPKSPVPPLTLYLQFFLLYDTELLLVLYTMCCFMLRIHAFPFPGISCPPCNHSFIDSWMG